MGFLFTKLDVYKKSLDFAENINHVTEQFPRGTWYLTDQLNRAALSISLNIAEGNGRFHDRERQNFFRIARGSAFECVPILELCKRKKMISQKVSDCFLKDLDDICKMLSGMINKKK